VERIWREQGPKVPQRQPKKLRLWENGYCESFNGKMRDEFLNREIFDTMFAVEVLTRKWVLEYNTIRPHSSLGYRPPAPQAIIIASSTNLISGIKNGGWTLDYRRPAPANSPPGGVYSCNNAA